MFNSDFALLSTVIFKFKLQGYNVSKSVGGPGRAYMEKLRNIGIIAHIDAGKTTLTERILYFSGKIHRMGEVHDGTATMDYMPEEQERGITIASACTACEWLGKRINIIDTPGHVDFTIEVERALRVLDGAVGVFCGVSGVEPQSETVWRQSEKYKVPKLAFINKMDRLGADFSLALQAMRDKLAANPLPLVVPRGAGAEFSGLFDLIACKVLIYEPGNGDEFSFQDPEGEDADILAQWRENLFDVLSEVDDEFMEAYLNEPDVPERLVREAIRRATLSRKVVPVFSGSALKNIGVQPVMDGICHYLPSPADVGSITGLLPEEKSKVDIVFDHKAPLAALVFKVTMETGRKVVLMRLYSGSLGEGETVYNVTQGKDERVARIFHMHAGRKEKLDRAYAGDIVAAAGVRFARTGDSLAAQKRHVLLESIGKYKSVISLALEPRNSEENDKLQEVLEHYLLEDPTLELETDEDTGQMILSGMGELHLAVVLDRLRREYKLEPRSGKPQVVFQETVGAMAEAEGEFDRELGDVPHYGCVTLCVEPRERDKGTDIVFEIDTQTWPTDIVTAVQEGVEDGLQSGVLKGFPVVDTRVRVSRLQGREKGQSDVGFRMAASMALKKALAEASPVLLEPIMKLEVSAPEEFVGDVIGLLGSKGAKVDNMFDHAGQKIVQALAPLRNLFGFTTDLRSATQGRAGMMMQFHTFDVLD